MKNLLIDTDPGMDDALGIVLALKSRELRARAITAATGNLTSDKTAANALRVLDLLGRDDIPVGQGPCFRWTATTRWTPSRTAATASPNPTSRPRPAP